MTHPLFEDPLPTPHGFSETSAERLSQHRQSVKLVDVREPEEFVGELGHIPGSELIPMLELPERARDWERSEPVVLICRSGARSGQMTLVLQQMGFEKVLNLRGGMIAWNGAGLEIER